MLNTTQHWNIKQQQQQQQQHSTFIYMTNSFSVLQFTLGPTKMNFSELVEHDFLQAGCPSCRPTNRIRALKDPNSIPSAAHKTNSCIGKGHPAKMMLYAPVKLHFISGHKNAYKRRLKNYKRCLRQIIKDA